MLFDRLDVRQGPLNVDNNSISATYGGTVNFSLDAGVTPDRTVISYCQLGVLSAHNYVALRLLGYPDVRLYDGSWADWTTDPQRPVATS